MCPGWTKLSMAVDAVCCEPVSSLQFGEMQGDFRKMQGGGRQNLAKSHQISIAWNGVSLLKRAGKSRENHLCPAAWRSRCAQNWGLSARTRIGFEPPASPFLGMSVGILGTDSMGLRTGYANAAAKLLGLNRCGQSRCGNCPKPSAARLPLPTQDRGKCRLGLLVLEGLDIAITGTEKLSVCDAGNVGS
jgi:hypothetical protein